MSPELARILVSGTFSEEERARILSAASRSTIEFVAGEEEIAARVADADGVAGRVGPAALAKAPRLRWVHSWAAGPDNDLYPEMLASPVVLTSAKGNGGIPLAEQAMLLMLMLNRNALRWVRSQDNHAWERFTHGELAGLTCGIIGLGHSGSDLATKARAFHMGVLGIRRRPDIPVPDVDELFPRERLHDFLAASDFVVVTAPRTSETVGMLGEAEFRAMKPSAYFVCISRGGIADDGALLRALQEGWIAGAGLDAHGTEPLPPDSAFWTAPNTIITPHNGATTEGTRRRGIEIFVENLRRFDAGESLTNVVDKHAGY
ncbi:D-2-hydroxyacid dehydrogenase [Actinopolymorpha alba]|uniref:D-2-hydroxyacid dehydrogenase n=1 Tax=Actinopolymorpha alba TaxID=533267 RepID=UPI00037CBA01|nr:D-2-hydroxyacid dehydrogenase [Actinopolymorpha alba]